MKYLAVIALTIGFFGACDAPKPAPVVPATESSSPLSVVEEPQHEPAWYSPFVVEVESGDLVFEHISFKDVGTNLKTKDREPMMETLAESLATALEHDDAFRSTWNLKYDAELMNAEAHLECGDHHLYVDVWDANGNWGYSLWSGCDENDNFASGEAVANRSADVSEHVAPLVQALTEDLKNAHLTKCFVKGC